MRKPRWKLDEAQKQQVETMAGLGLIQEEIATILGVSVETLQRAMKKDNTARDVFETGRAKAKLRVTKTLYEMATVDKVPSAAIFWLKTQGGPQWRQPMETQINQINVQQTVNSQAPKREITEQDRNRLLDVVLKLKSNPEDPQCKSILNSLQQSQQLEAQSSPARLVTACSDKKSQG